MLNIQQLKNTLCDAVSKRLVIQLKYDDDLRWRSFEPQAVYQSTADNLDVTGIQTQNPNSLTPSERKVRNFTLSRIKVVEVTQTQFEFDPTFDSTHKRFAHGVFCYIKAS